MIFKKMFFQFEFVNEQFLVSCMSTVQFFFLGMAPFGGKGTTQSGHASLHIFHLFFTVSKFCPKGKPDNVFVQKSDSDIIASFTTDPQSEISVFTSKLHL